MSKNACREEYNSVHITYVYVYMYKVYHGLGTVMAAHRKFYNKLFK